MARGHYRSLPSADPPCARSRPDRGRGCGGPRGYPQGRAVVGARVRPAWGKSTVGRRRDVEAVQRSGVDSMSRVKGSRRKAGSGRICCHASAFTLTSPANARHVNRPTWRHRRHPRSAASCIGRDFPSFEEFGPSSTGQVGVQVPGIGAAAEAQRRLPPKHGRVGRGVGGRAGRTAGSRTGEARAAQQALTEA